MSAKRMPEDVELRTIRFIFHHLAALTSPQRRRIWNYVGERLDTIPGSSASEEERHPDMFDEVMPARRNAAGDGNTCDEAA